MRLLLNGKLNFRALLPFINVSKRKRLIKSRWLRLRRSTVKTQIFNKPLYVPVMQFRSQQFFPALAAGRVVEFTNNQEEMDAHVGFVKYSILDQL